jgi:GNAT superfamily N-acetyltransferase
MDARAFRVEDTLRNGVPVTFRAARPDDAARLVKAFEGLERESVRTRFFGYRAGPTPRELGRLGDIDFVHDVMLVATVLRDGDEVVVGTGRYAAAREPGAPPSAEVAFTVEEDFQGQGIASRLLGHLAAIARANGLATLEAYVLAENRSMLSVFSRSGFAMTQRREPDAIHVTLALSAGA